MKFPSLLFASLLTASAADTVPADTQEAAYPTLERFVEVLETVRARHPDLDKLTYDRLINQALDGMLSSLDAHSSFIHPEMQKMVSKEGILDNEISSLGMSIGKDSGKTFISAVAGSGSAQEAGLVPRTTILRINGAEPGESDLAKILERFRGRPGDKLKLTLRNPERPRRNRGGAHPSLCRGALARRSRPPPLRSVRWLRPARLLRRKLRT